VSQISAGVTDGSIYVTPPPIRSSISIVFCGSIWLIPINYTKGSMPGCAVVASCAWVTAKQLNDFTFILWMRDTKKMDRRFPSKNLALNVNRIIIISLLI